MSTETPLSRTQLDILNSPKDNFSRGLLSVEIPELGKKIEGKVRDIWVVEGLGQRVMVTTDRQSAFDRMVCTIPGKGRVLNGLSAFWFDRTEDIVQNHSISVPHPNVLIARQARDTLPVEVIVRGHMAKSGTSTSVYHNYVELSRREIYGIKFPEGLKANQEFPMGPIVTPTTKAELGHDEELTSKQAEQIVDAKFGKGMWKRTQDASLVLFNRGVDMHKQKGLILVDTKYEFGVDDKGELMLIDEIHTPDSSRLWLASTYLQKFDSGETPDTFDKEILRRWLVEQGFRGKGQVPLVDQKIIDQMSLAYKEPYKMITGRDLSTQRVNPEEIRQAIKRYYQ